MPGFLLDTSVQVMCAHGALATPTVPNKRVTVMGKPTAVQSSAYSVGSCSHNVSGVPSPCVTAQWTVAATRVRSIGQPVLLQDSQTVCTPNGTPLTVVVKPTRVRGM